MSMGLVFSAEYLATKKAQSLAHQIKWVCPKKVMAHMWFMHDAHLGRAFFVNVYSG